MSNDIATISLRVNTTELERGNQALERFQETATAAAGKADDLTVRSAPASITRRRTAKA
ncbi:hypothetical protein ENINCK380B_21415 [Enterobacter intestinihominis]